MQDALEALRTAASELRNAAETMPDDLREQLEALVRQAESVVESVRAKLGPADDHDAAG